METHQAPGYGPGMPGEAACDNTDCPAYNRDMSLSELTRPGPGFWRRGDRVVIDGRTDAVAAVDGATVTLRSGRACHAAELTIAPARDGAQGVIFEGP